jgi:5-methylcytosine-specific restriction protein B
MILYGPPGTGKTFLARELAKHITGDADAEAGAGQNSAGGADASECWELVQFHPSYAYEDIVEGIRPKIGQGTAKGTVEFALHAGPLRRIAEQAAQHPEHNYVLIIDEINRADLARVFGELYYLLEYRGETVTLQYSNEKLTLPKNLYFIGTMNTADRSIALVDAAIRRRFPFVEMHPGTEPVKGLLANVYGKDDNRTKLLDALNEAIGEDKRDLWIGPSYLMRKKPSDGAPTPTELERVWKYDILPRLAEEFYDDEHGDVANQFSLDTIAKKAGVKLTAEKPAAETDGDGTGAGHESPASGGATEQPAEGNHTDGTAADQAAAGSGAGTVAPGGTPTPSPDPASGN